MNKQRLLALADTIATKKWAIDDEDPQGNNFDMCHVFLGRDCNTPACICGWAIFLWATEEQKEEFAKKPPKQQFALGAEILGLGFWNSHRLFNHESDDGNESMLEYITPERAAKTIRHYVASGIVEWPEAWELKEEARKWREEHD